MSFSAFSPSKLLPPYAYIRPVALNIFSLGTLIGDAERLHYFSQRWVLSGVPIGKYIRIKMKSWLGQITVDFLFQYESFIAFFCLICLTWSIIESIYFIDFRLSVYWIQDIWISILKRVRLHYIDLGMVSLGAWYLSTTNV